MAITAPPGYTPYYGAGWANDPAGGTALRQEALNSIENAIKAVYQADQLYNLCRDGKLTPSYNSLAPVNIDALVTTALNNYSGVFIPAGYWQLTPGVMKLAQANQAVMGIPNLSCLCPTPRSDGTMGGDLITVSANNATVHGLRISPWNNGNPPGAKLWTNGAPGYQSISPTATNFTLAVHGIANGGTGAGWSSGVTAGQPGYGVIKGVDMASPSSTQYNEFCTFSYTSRDSTHFFGCNWIHAPAATRLFGDNTGVGACADWGAAIRLCGESQYGTFDELYVDSGWWDGFVLGDDGSRPRTSSDAINQRSAQHRVVNLDTFVSLGANLYSVRATLVSGQNFAPHEAGSPGLAVAGIDANGVLGYGANGAPIIGCNGDNAIVGIPAYASGQIPKAHISAYIDTTHVTITFWSSTDPGWRTYNGVRLQWSNTAASQAALAPGGNPGCGGSNYFMCGLLTTWGCVHAGIAAYNDFDANDKSNEVFTTTRFEGPGQFGISWDADGGPFIGVGKVHSMNYGLEITNKCPEGTNGNVTGNTYVAAYSHELIFCESFRFGVNSSCNFGGIFAASMKCTIAGMGTCVIRIDRNVPSVAIHGFYTAIGPNTKPPIIILGADQGSYSFDGFIFQNENVTAFGNFIMATRPGQSRHVKLGASNAFGICCTPFSFGPLQYPILNATGTPQADMDGEYQQFIQPMYARAVAGTSTKGWALGIKQNHAYRVRVAMGGNSSGNPVAAELRGTLYMPNNNTSSAVWVADTGYPPFTTLNGINVPTFVWQFGAYDNTGAFSNAAAPNLSAQILLTVTGGAGTFTLTYNALTTASIAYNASASAVAAALNALTGYSGFWTVTGPDGGPFVISLIPGNPGGLTLALTGAGAGGATVAINQPGVSIARLTMVQNDAGNLLNGKVQLFVEGAGLASLFTTFNNLTAVQMQP